MNDARCAKGSHNAKQVLMDKISVLEQSFNKAYDWSEGQTGLGLKESDEGSFNNYCKRLCKNYFDLLPIMKDHANAKPKMTSDDIASDLDTLSPGSSDLNDEDSSAESITDVTGSSNGSSNEWSSYNNRNTFSSGRSVTEKSNSASNKKTNKTKKSRS